MVLAPERSAQTYPVRQDENSSSREEETHDTVVLTYTQRRRIASAIRADFVREATQARLFLPWVRAPHVSAYAPIVLEVAHATGITTRGSLVRVTEELREEVMGKVHNHIPEMFRLMGYSHLTYRQPSCNGIERLTTINQIIKAMGCTPVYRLR